MDVAAIARDDIAEDIKGRDGEAEGRTSAGVGRHVGKRQATGGSGADGDRVGRAGYRIGSGVGSANRLATRSSERGEKIAEAAAQGGVGGQAGPGIGTAKMDGAAIAR